MQYDIISRTCARVISKQCACLYHICKKNILNSKCMINEPAHEIMALFVLPKLTLQTCMRSHPVGLDV